MLRNLAGALCCGAAAASVAQQLVASDASPEDQFGYAVAVSGDGTVALIGAPWKTTAAGPTGAVYTYQRTGTTWRQLGAAIPANDAANGDYFGSAVAISNDGWTSLVGAPYKNGTVGAAYVYLWTGSAMVQQGSALIPSDMGPYNRFGTAVALSGDGTTALVGAYGLDNNMGGAYLFIWDYGANTFVQAGPPLTAPWANRTAGDFFGVSVSLSADGQTALVGAPGRNNFTGGAYVFWLGNGTWSHGGYLVAPFQFQGDNFGMSVAISGDASTAVVGTFGAQQEAGAAHVYVLDAAGYYQHEGRALIGSNRTRGDHLGRTVAINANGKAVLVAAPVKNGTGAVYRFDCTAAAGQPAGAPCAWGQTGPAEQATDGVWDTFGWAMALSADGTSAIVGGYGRLSETGAAYALQWSSPAPPAPTAATPSHVGAAVGATIVVLLVLGAAGGGFVWYRRRGSTLAGAFGGRFDHLLLRGGAGGGGAAPSTADAYHHLGADGSLNAAAAPAAAGGFAGGSSNAAADDAFY